MPIVDEYRDALEDMVNQFAYWGNGGYVTGGLSALEHAFAVLGWDEPHVVKELWCDEPGCRERITCGTRTTTGYRRTCSKHRLKREANHA